MNLLQFIEEFIRENKELVSRTPVIWASQTLAISQGGESIEFTDSFPVTVVFSEIELSRGFFADRVWADLGKVSNIDRKHDLDDVDWSRSTVHIHHRFIFDRRLIPSEFNGVRVDGVTYGDMPKEFPSENCAMYEFEYFAPIHYEKFVDNNFEYISKKMKLENANRSELLDALTGDFKKHVEEWESKKKQILEGQKDEIAFFRQLLQRTESAYQQSDVKKNFPDKNWGYSVTATQIMKGKPLIVGFNWGVDSAWTAAGNEYAAQKEYPLRIFGGNYDDLGSLQRTISFFHDHFPRAAQGMQTNYCFFRSEREDQVSGKDLELSRPLFEEYLKFSEPSTIITFSSKLRDYLISTERVKDEDSLYVKYLRGSLQIVKGSYLFDETKRIPFVYLPHPNSRVSSVDRKRAWQFCLPIDDETNS